jgi:hypothetical protein
MRERESELKEHLLESERREQGRAPILTPEPQTLHYKREWSERESEAEPTPYTPNPKP